MFPPPITAHKTVPETSIHSSRPSLRRRVVVDGVALRLRLPAKQGTGRLANRGLTLASQREASHQSVVDGVALRLRLPAKQGTGRLANRGLTLASQHEASHQSVVDGVALRLRLPAKQGTGRLANRGLTLASQREASHQSVVDGVEDQSQHSHDASRCSAIQPPACRWIAACRAEARRKPVKPSQSQSK